MLPIILKLKLATSAAVGLAAAASPAPVAGPALATMIVERTTTPVEVKLFDENHQVTATVAIRRDGSMDGDTAAEVTHLFRCKVTERKHPIAKKTLAMLADIAEKYQGKTIEFVSAYRVQAGESPTSPHRDARAIDFRIRGTSLTEIRDYLWRKYTDVGIGWYPSEQFIHMDTRPGLHDTAWTFMSGDNHYHPYWAEVARRPVTTKTARPDHRPGV
ncbi:MAG TPA: DUF882 domain-containing protein [Kofleriaceae bacterium]|nr:DUF882 domain-containing protein [Kofleriaceae bacterium]